MKQIYIENQTQSIHRTNAALVKPKNHKIAQAGLQNIFLDQNIGKGPPGPKNSPGFFQACPGYLIPFYYSELHYKLLIKPNLFHTFLNF